MDPITIVGAVAAVAQLLDQSTKTAASARKIVQSIINAPAEVAQLGAKLDRLRMLIGQIQKFVEEGSSAKECDAIFPTSYREILYNCLKSNVDALQALHSLTSLENNKSLGVRKRVRWATIDKRKAAAIHANIRDAEIELDAAISILGVRLGSMNQTSLAALRSTQETFLQGLENTITEIRRHMDFQFARVIEEKGAEITTVSDITRNVWDELKVNSDKLDRMTAMLLVSEKRSQTLTQKFEKSQRQLINNETSKAKHYMMRDPSQLSQLEWTATRAEKSKLKTQSGLTQYPRNFLAFGTLNEVGNTTDLDSIVQTRLVEHAMRATRKKHSWAFGSVDELLTDTLKPKVGVKITATSKRNLRKARVVLKVGLRLIYQHIIQFELQIRHDARCWTSIPWLGCSLTTVNVRAVDAPIFQACYDWDLDTVQFLLETKKASIYDVDEKARCGLLEHVFRTNSTRFFNEPMYYDPSTFRGHLVLQHLLDQGCDPNIYHGLQARPATLAAFQCSIMDALASLLLHGAELDSFEINPSSLFTAFQPKKYRSQLQLLRSTGFSDWKVEGNTIDLLHVASNMGDLEEVLFALEVAYIDPNTHDGLMRTPLFNAATSNSVAIASALLERGAFPNSGSMSWNGPPLLRSIEWGNIDMAHWLLFHGADTSLTDCHMKTPWCRIWELILKNNQALDFMRFELLFTHLLLHNADPFQVMQQDHHEETCKVMKCNLTFLWYNHLGQIKSLEYARAWSFDLHLSSIWPEPTVEQRLGYENAEMGRKPSGCIHWTQRGIVFRDEYNAPGSCLNPGKLRFQGDEDQDEDGDEDQDEVSDYGSNSAGDSFEYIAEAPSHTDGNEFIHGPTLFYQVISTPEGRAQMSTFPAVRLLSNALQLAGYRAEQDMEGDIWYEDDDGDMYYDTQEHQPDDDDMDGPTIDCPICKDPEKYGLGHILRDAEYGRQKLFEYREKVRKKGKRWL